MDANEAVADEAEHHPGAVIETFTPTSTASG